MKTMKPTGGRPTSERAAAMNAAIVEAVVDAFARDGSDFSMDQVAISAGVSKQAIYRRWATKTHLLVHVVEEVLADWLNAAVQDLPADPVEALRAAAWVLFDRDHRRDHRIGIFLQAEALRDDGLAQRMLVWDEQFSAVHRDLLQAIVGEGADVELEADILMDIMDGATTKLAMHGLSSDEDKRRTFDARWGVFLRMLAPRL